MLSNLVTECASARCAVYKGSTERRKESATAADRRAHRLARSVIGEPSPGPRARGWRAGPARVHERRDEAEKGRIEKGVALKEPSLAAFLAGMHVVLTNVAPASAQLMLPGAVHAVPEGGGARSQQGSREDAEAGQGKPKLARIQPPAEATILGRVLARDGSSGVMAFESAAAKDLVITSLSLDGEEISRPESPCRVEVVAGAPITARFSDRNAGLSRYEVELAACPFSFEVLDGAVLVTRALAACAFTAADCRVDPTGLWGPRGDEIDDRQIKQWERARAQAEAAMRANFRALLASAGTDRDAVKRIAGEQAGFSSERSMACSAYAGEDLHGFCALRLTEARVIALQARREAAAKGKFVRPSAQGLTRSSAPP
jgi:hypothetical protein